MGFLTPKIYLHLKGLYSEERRWLVSLAYSLSAPPRQQLWYPTIPSPPQTLLFKIIIQI